MTTEKTRRCRQVQMDPQGCLAVALWDFMNWDDSDDLLGINSSRNGQTFLVGRYFYNLLLKYVYNSDTTNDISPREFLQLTRLGLFVLAHENAWRTGKL